MFAIYGVDCLVVFRGGMMLATAAIEVSFFLACIETF